MTTVSEVALDVFRIVTYIQHPRVGPLDVRGQLGVR